MTARMRSALGLLALVLVVAAVSAGWRRWHDARLGSVVAAHAAAGDIAMIASDACAFCAQARGWMQDHGVAFSECSIERDADCAARYRALASPGTPVLLVRGQAQLGFSARRVAVALGAS